MFWKVLQAFDWSHKGAYNCAGGLIHKILKT
jgi:hypothetical protein